MDWFWVRDIVSAMYGIGKKTAWNAWAAYPPTPSFAITQNPTSLTLEPVHMQVLEHWTLLMYGKNCGVESVNEARKLLFTYGLKSLDSILLTQHALFQHGKQKFKIPVSGFWERNDRTKIWVPYWTDGRCQQRMLSPPQLWLCGCL